MNGLLEILTNKQWMVHPDFLKAVRPMIQQNLNGHVALTLKDKRIAARAYASTGFDIDERKVSAKDGTTIYSWRENANDPFISILYVDGPVTRNGGECTYGSVEHRDMMMEAADNPLCIGHIFYINTPGGSAWAKNDYQQAIDYAHERGQKVYAFVDGMCCSAGMYLAALCDERYYMHPKDQIGCIGVMAAFYTIADGAHNKYDETTYHEIYDPESFEKNKEIRDIANDNNDELLVKELADLGVEFRADVKAHCPKAQDEHLHGKVFDAADVKGILMDGQSTLGDLFAKIIKDAAAAGNQSAQAAQRQTIFNNNNQTEINMKEQFPALFAALQVEEMQMQEGGAFVNTDLLATLNAAIEAKEKAAADAQALVESLTAEKNDLTAKVESLNADIEAKNLEIANLTENAGKADETLKAKDDEIATLNTDIQSKQAAIDGAKAEMEQKDATIATLNDTIAQKEIDFKAKEDALAAAQTELAGAKESLTTAERTLAERDQTITDLNAQLTELQNNPGAEPQAGAAPQNNGGADAPQLVVNQYVYDPALSYKENRELETKWNAEHGKA